MATAAAQGALDIPPPSAPSPAPEPPAPAPEASAPAPEPEKPAKGGRFGNAFASFASAAKGAAESAASMAADAADSAGRAFDEAAGERMSGEVDIPQGLNFPSFAPSDDAWTWRDLPRAFVGVMDLRRVLFAIAGFWAVLVAFGLVQWLGGFLGNKVWGPLGSVLDIAAWVVFVGGAAVVVSVMSYVVYITVIEQKATSVKQGIEWTKARLKAVVGTPLAFAALILGAGVAEALVGLLGRIPFAGPIVWGVVSPLLWIVSIAAGLVAVALAYCLPLYVPIIHDNEGIGPKGTLLRLLELFKAHGARLLSYTLLSAVTIALAFYVTLLPAMGVAAKLTLQVGNSSMGPNFGQTVGSIPPGFSGVLSSFAAAFGGGGGGGNFGHTLGGWFAGFGFLIPQAVVLATIGLTYMTAGSIIYAIVTGRKKA
jgi:hypothetical protein